ncbi:MAG TPA: DUF448 domain-containing protein [Acidimicrobiaceae bacterium]|nr:DUF448 domain-containing protein [Acidimicrobiaceae bacterium]
MTPTRTCIGCRTRQPPGLMVRISLQAGVVVAGSQVGGRGAWLCPSQSCLDQAVRRRALLRALRLANVETANQQLRDSFEGLPFG